MATRRRSSVSFQLHDNPLQLPQTATTHGPQGTTSSRIRRALPLPLLAFGLGMAAMGGWVWAAPAFVYAGLELYKGSKACSKGHTRRLSASGRARRASSGNVADLLERVRGRSLSSKLCCICLDSIPDDEPCSNLFDCKHDAQTHKACIDKWLEKHDTCPLCRRDAKDPVMGEMRKYPLDVAAQIRGCRFIVFKGWQNELYLRHFLKVGAAELIAAALEAHASNPKVVAACCAAIFVIAFSSKETQGRLSSLGVCKRVVEAMDTHTEDLEVAARGCGAIYALSLSNKETQLQLCEAKAPAACLKAMLRYMDDPSTALSAADAFMSLSCDNNLGQNLLGSGEGAGAELDGKGACELLADLVDRYGADRDVMYAGLDAVMKLAIDNPENRLRFGAAGMCRKVMDSFEVYQDDEIFLLVALTAVYTMAENQKENQARLLEDNGAQTLMATLRRHEGCRDVVSVGLDVLFALTYHAVEGPNTVSHSALLEVGACDFILNSLQSYPRSPEIYGPGLKATACLLTSVETQTFITGPEWCQVVCDSMRQSIEVQDMPVIENCCRVLGNLALHSEVNQAALREAGACRVVCDCLRKGFCNWQALEAVADLAYGNPDNRRELGRCDAVALVVKSIEKDLSDLVAFDIAVMALTNLVQDDVHNASRLQTQKVRIQEGGKEYKLSVYALLSHRLGSDSLVFGERACILMTALSIVSLNNPKAQSEIGDANGCWSVVERVKIGAGGYPGEARLQKCPGPEAAVMRQGLQLISDLAAQHPANQDRLREACGLELLWRLLPEFARDPLDAALWLLTASMLAEGNPLNQQRLVDLGVAAKAMELHQQFPEDEEVLCSVLGCLTALAANDRGHQDHIGSLGACEMVSQVVMRAVENPHLLTRCCSFVMALSELQKFDADGRALHIWKDNTYSNKSRLRESGAIASFCKALTSNILQGADPVMLSSLILSLALIAEDDVPTFTQLRNEGVFQLVVDLISQYPHEDTILMAASGIISTCSVVFNDDWTDWSLFETPIKKNQDIFIAGGAIPYILNAMRTTPPVKSSIVMSFISLSGLAWQNVTGIQLLVDAVESIDEVLASAACKGPDSLFYGLLVLGSILSFPDPDVKVLARCCPIIYRWEKVARETYPDNTCLVRLRGILMAHIQKAATVHPFGLDAA